MNIDRFNRQERLFGSDGQKRIRDTRVTIIGAGGLGSLIIQLLARLGVDTICFVDHDVVENTNLNRLIGATRKDTLSGANKVDVMKRMVKAIDPDIICRAVAADLRTEKAFNVLKDSTHVFGCVDNDGPRLILTEFCSAYEIPYIDLASGVDSGPPLHYGGHVFVNTDHNGCLHCYDEISTTEAQSYLESKEMQKTRAAIYGIEQEVLSDSGPSVVSLNAVIAGHAAMEFMVMVTNLRKPSRFLTYRGDWGGIVCKSNDLPAEPDCYYCKSVRGMGESANVERYVL